MKRKLVMNCLFDFKGVIKGNRFLLKCQLQASLIWTGMLCSTYLEKKLFYFLLLLLLDGVWLKFNKKKNLYLTQLRVVLLMGEYAVIMGVEGF